MVVVVVVVVVAVVDSLRAVSVVVVVDFAVVTCVTKNDMSACKIKIKIK